MRLKAPQDRQGIECRLSVCFLQEWELWRIERWYKPDDLNRRGRGELHARRHRKPACRTLFRANPTRRSLPVSLPLVPFYARMVNETSEHLGKRASG